MIKLRIPKLIQKKLKTTKTSVFMKKATLMPLSFVREVYQTLWNSVSKVTDQGHSNKCLIAKLISFPKNWGKTKENVFFKEEITVSFDSVYNRKSTMKWLFVTKKKYTKFTFDIVPYQLTSLRVYWIHNDHCTSN